MDNYDRYVEIMAIAHEMAAEPATQSKKVTAALYRIRDAAWSLYQAVENDINYSEGGE